MSGHGDASPPPTDAVASWIAAFVERTGRRPRVLHIGNIANNAYLNARMLEQAGFECDVLCYDYYHIMGCPEWEEAELDTTDLDHFAPAWHAMDLGSYERPRWFVQGPLDTCFRYLEARASGDAATMDHAWHELLHASGVRADPPGRAPTLRASGPGSGSGAAAPGMGIAGDGTNAAADRPFGRRIVAAVRGRIRHVLQFGRFLVARGIILTCDLARYAAILCGLRRLWRRRSEARPLRTSMKLIDWGRTVWGETLLRAHGHLVRANHPAADAEAFRTWWSSERSDATGQPNRDASEAGNVGVGDTGGDGDGDGVGDRDRVGDHDGDPAGDRDDAPFDVRRTIRPLIRGFDELFPARHDILQPQDIAPYLGVLPRWHALLTRYDAVIGYATDGLYPLLCGTRPYLAFEHGTIRNIPFEATTQGRLCALAFRLADVALITNCDNIVAAERLELSNHRFVPHPVNEAHRDDPGGAVLRDRLRAELDSDFIVFHPARQHWEPDTRHPDWEKGNDRLIRGFAHFVKTCNPRAAAVFVAWGNTLDASRALLEELGVADRVRWIPPQPNRAMSRYVQASDVVADQFHLGAFGSLTPKALMFATPVLLHLDQDRHRWCFPQMPPVLNVREPEAIGKALERLYTDAAFARGIAEASLGWYEAYHSNAAISSILGDAIARAMDGRPTPPPGSGVEVVAGVGVGVGVEAPREGEGEGEGGRSGHGENAAPIPSIDTDLSQRVRSGPTSAGPRQPTPASNGVPRDPSASPSRAADPQSPDGRAPSAGWPERDDAR